MSIHDDIESKHKYGSLTYEKIRLFIEEIVEQDSKSKQLYNWLDTLSTAQREEFDKALKNYINKNNI